MDLIRRQVMFARRRLLLQQFVAVAPWCFFTPFLVALVALAIPKIWVLNVDPETWLWSWVGGAAGLGLLAAGIATWVGRRRAMDAAIEIDRRFGLKERVSSAWSLQPAELDTDAGRALVSDAVQRVEMLVVSEKFGLNPGWKPLLPLGTAAAAFLVALLVPNAIDQEAQAAALAAAQQKQQVKTSAQELKKKLEKKKEEALQSGLKDAEELFKKLTNGLDELERKDDVDQKKALVKLNDLASELARRKDALGNQEQLKQQLDKLKNLEKGPAEKVADALKEGNFEQAAEKLSELLKKLEKGELSKDEQQQLLKQFEQMQQGLREMAEAHREAKRELEDEIKKKMAEGNLEAVNRLQKQLDELRKADRQMSRMENMAKNLADAEKALREGDGQKAAEQLARMQQGLEAMQADMQEMQSLQELMDQLADAKDAMRCQSCSGEGCQECQGEGGSEFGDMQGNSQSDGFGTGQGMNQGRGNGERPEEETKTGNYDSRVRGDPKSGTAVRIGDAGGRNQAGQATESIAERIESALSRDAEALTDQRLPRSQQDHVKAYYERLRKGE